MARPTNKLLNDLLAKFEPELRDAFLAAFDDIRNRAALQEIVDRIAAGDVEGALRALHIDPEAFQDFEQAIANAYRSGGTTTSNDLPALTDRVGLQMIVRFDARNPRAENWLKTYSSTLIRQIVADQQEMIREHLRAGMEAGNNPRTAALDLVGRIDQRTQKRIGGVIGLTSQQEKYIRNAALELASEDPKVMANWLTRKLRDRRYDSTVLKAMKAGQPVAAETRKVMIVRYHDALLRLRGETIARTEAMTALHTGQDEALRQLVETGQIAPSQIRRIWRSAADKRVRDTHVALNGESVGYGEAFTSPSGARIMYPGDPNAPAEEVINCRCDLTVRIDFLANIR